MVTSEELEELDNKELRAKCLAYGLPNVPVTDTTRKLLIRRLVKAMNSGTSPPRKDTTPARPPPEDKPTTTRKTMRPKISSAAPAPSAKSPLVRTGKVARTKQAQQQKSPQGPHYPQDNVREQPMAVGQELVGQRRLYPDLSATFQRQGEGQMQQQTRNHYLSSLSKSGVLITSYRREYGSPMAANLIEERQEEMDVESQEEPSEVEEENDGGSIYYNHRSNSTPTNPAVAAYGLVSASTPSDLELETPYLRKFSQRLQSLKAQPLLSPMRQGLERSYSTSFEGHMPSEAQMAYKPSQAFRRNILEGSRMPYYEVDEEQDDPVDDGDGARNMLAQLWGYLSEKYNIKQILAFFFALIIGALWYVIF